MDEFPDFPWLFASGKNTFNFPDFPEIPLTRTNPGIFERPLEYGEHAPLTLQSIGENEYRMVKPVTQRFSLFF